MLHFEQPLYFYLLLAVPILLVLFIVVTKNNNRLRANFGALLGLERLAPHISKVKRPLKFALLLGVFTILVIALANPRMGNKTQSVKREGLDVFIALDISKSMWAQDVKPNRMERARQFTQNLITAIQGDRVGLILFAGVPFLQMPLTTDYSAAQLFVRTASPQLDITQGTAIESAIDLVVELGNKEEQQKQRALIVITDGENHEEAAVAAARIANGKGVSTYLVAIGTEAGGPIPIPQPDGRTNYQLDKNGQIVQSVMNIPLLEQIAKAGGGSFQKVADTNVEAVIARLRHQMSKLEKSEFEQHNFDTFETYFQYFVAIALLLLIIEFFITYRKSTWLKSNQ